MPSSLTQDLRYAGRQLAGSPGFTLVAVFTLALGIGACVAIFSVVNGVLLRPLPFPDSQRVIAVHETLLPVLPRFSTASGKLFVWRKQARSFASLAAFRSASFNLTGVGEPLRLDGVRLSANALATLQVQPLLGRGFREGEDSAGRDPVAMLGHGLWQRLFGGRTDVVGTSIQLDGRSYTVVGVMPPEWPLPEPADVLLPFAFDDQARANFGGHDLHVFGRLAPGVTLAQAASEMKVIAERLGREQPSAAGWSVKLEPMLTAMVGEVRPVLLSLLGAVGLLLLIACANVANLLLARATARTREMAVRAALGASTGRIVRQLLVESLLLALVGGLLGVVVAQLGLEGLLALAPADLPRAEQIALDGRALGFALLLAAATGVVFGLAPAFQAARVDVNQHLKEGGRGASVGGAGQRLRAALVVAELAVALSLLTGAGLLMRSFTRLQEVPLGFRAPGALTARVDLPALKYRDDARRVELADRVLERLAAVPGVEAVGASRSLPLAPGQETRRVRVQGRPPAGLEDGLIANNYAVTPGYFPALGIPLLRGRRFDRHDREGGQKVAIVSEGLARRLFPGEQALGKSINISNDDSWRTIVGVVGDVKPNGFDSEVTVQSYEPLAQQPSLTLQFVVRTARAGDAGGAALAQALRAAVQSVDPAQPVARLRLLNDYVAEVMSGQRFAMFLFGVFSAVALCLSAIGIYGVMAYSVRQRRMEIGIRVSLGARAADVLRLVLSQGGWLVALGLAAGVALALALTHLLDELLFQVSAHDPATFAVTALLLAAVAGLACLLPARRAARVDPMTVLRDG